MTVAKLHRLLGKLIDQGSGCLPVVIGPFMHPLEPDGCVMLDIRDASIRFFPVLDEDGFAQVLHDGGENEKMRTAVVLVGEATA